jgi:KDO2-lipid IV(A) lauroyltransferase
MAKWDWKKFRRDAARNGLFIFTGIFKLVPYGLVRAIAWILIGIGYVLTVRLKNIARESLHIAFGQEKTRSEIEGIVKKCFRNFGQGIIELVYFMEHPKLIREHVIIEGQDILERAFSQGKGVIAVSAHFGNFPLMLLRFAQEGEKYFCQKRSSLGLNTIYAIPRTECVSQCLKVLRNNELLFIPLDQNFGSAGGVFVDFFGQQAATATGPVVFARRTQAPLIPIFIVREANDRHRIIIEPPLTLEEDVSESRAIEKNIAKITKIIEGYVRKYPHEWGWMHRRWKSKAEEIQNRSSH